MLRIILVFSCVCSAFASKAQFKARQFELGLSGFYFGSNYEATNGFSTISGFSQEGDLNLRAGVFITDKVSLGLFTSGTYQSRLVYDVLTDFNNKEQVDYRWQLSQLLSGVYGRYYLSLSEKLGGFMQLDWGIGNSSSSYNQEDSLGGISTVEDLRNQRAFSVGVGLNYMPSPNVGLQIMGQRYTRFESYDVAIGSAGTVNITETFAGSRLQVGLVVYLDVWKSKSELDRKYWK